MTAMMHRHRPARNSVRGAMSQARAQNDICQAPLYAAYLESDVQQ